MKMMSKKRWRLILLICKVEEKTRKPEIIKIKMFHNNPHKIRTLKKNYKNLLRLPHNRIKYSKNQKLNKKKHNQL